MLATTDWHLVRYTTPAVALALAAGLIGFARVGSWILRRRGRRWMLAALWVALASGLLAARFEVMSRLDRVPGPIPASEARAIRSWIARVAAGEGVLAAYEIAAPLSSREHLYSYVMDINFPPGFPRIAPVIRWAFVRPPGLDPQLLLGQGFEIVYPGESLWVYRRPAAADGPPSAWPDPATKNYLRPNPTTAALPTLVPALSVALWGWIRLGPIRRRSLTARPSTMTGAELASAIIETAAVEGISIVPAAGSLANFYDPGPRELRLSRAVFEGRSPAALAVAAHEAGHALQGRWTAGLRTALVFATAWAAAAGWIAVASGLIFVVARLALWGSLLVAASALAGLARLPIERAANRRARRGLADAGLGAIAASRELAAVPWMALAAVLPGGRRAPAVADDGRRCEAETS
jgi:hypothetical protein